MKVILLALLISSIQYAQWLPDTRLVGGYSELSYNNARCIKVISDTVHVVFNRAAGDKEISYIRSINNGSTWSLETPVSHNPAYSVNPSIAAENNIIHVAWEDYRDTVSEIYYNHSNDGGVTWGTDIRLTNSAAVSYNPSIAVSGTNIHIVWHDQRDGNYEIYYKQSTNNGLTWGNDIRLTSNIAISNYASISVSGSNIHVVFYDDRDLAAEIYYKRSTDNGLSWQPDTRLTNQPNLSRTPCISSLNNTIHVVWEDNRGSAYRIYYKQSTDNGSNWSADFPLSEDVGSGGGHLIPPLLQRVQKFI